MAPASIESDGTSADVLVGGIGTLRFVTQDSPGSGMSETLHGGQEWQPFESLIFRSLVGPGAFVCDIGANVGWYSVMASKLGADVVALEPDETLFELLVANLELNDCSSVHARRGGGLAETISNRFVDVLRVDARSADEVVLGHAGATLRASCGAVLVAVDARALHAAGSSASAALATFAELGLVPFEIDSVGRALLRTSFGDLIERTDEGHYSSDGAGALHVLLLDSSNTDRMLHLIADRPTGRPLIELLDPEERRRVELTVSCLDSAQTPKVPDAGSIRTFRDHDVQIMHNGVRVVKGGYYGEWMTEIISRLNGHHEPQEERVFHAIVDRLSHELLDHQPSMVELGAFWSYYALWFMEACPGGRAVLVEPDPHHLAVAHTNLALNDREALVIQAGVGRSQRDVTFECEGGHTAVVDMLTLIEVLDAAQIERADVVVSDIQGAETEMLETACEHVSRRVRFLIVSTHHASISGRWDTHERCLSIIRQCGGHIIAEHTVGESFSGDGLIAASFDPRDRDMSVELSAARTDDSLFRPAEGVVAELQRHISNLEESRDAAVEYALSLERHSALLEASAQESARYAASLETLMAQQRSR